MADLDRIKRNIGRMISMNAPDADIDAYVSSEGVTVEDVRAHKLGPEPEKTDKERAIEHLQQPGAAQRVLRGVPGLGGVLDEIGAGADAALNFVSGGRTGAPHSEALQQRRAAQRKSDAENPIRNTVDAVLGAAVSAAAAPFVRPFQAAAGPGIAAAGADGALNAAAYAGLTGFGEGEGGLANRIETAKDYATMAAPIGLLAGGAGQAIANRLAGTGNYGAASIAAEAAPINVTVPRFMEGGRASQNIAGKLGGIPFIGDDINASVARTRSQTGAAAERISEQAAGGATTPQAAGEAARGAMQTYVGPTARAMQERVYRPVNQAMGNTPAPLNSTARVTQVLQNEQAATANPAINAVAIREVTDAVTRPGGLTFEGMTRLRTRIGDMIDNTIDANNIPERAALQRLYGALSQDMDDAVTAIGGPRVQQMWQSANAITRQLAERRGQVAGVIGREGERPGEAVVEKVVSMASTKGSANAAGLDQIRRATGPEAWRQVAGAAIQRLGRNQSNEFSADIFLKNFRQLSDDGRRVLFETTGDPTLLENLNRLAAVSTGLRAFGRLGNPSGSGGVGALLTALVGVGAGDAGATAGAMLAGRGVGLLMSRPAVVRGMSQYAQAFDRYLNGQATRAQLSTVGAVLAQIVARETGEDHEAIKARIDEAAQRAHDRP